MPVSSLNARAKWRSLMCGALRRARRPTRSASRLSVIHACSSRSGARAAACACSPALNCAWPPGRRTKSTSLRATSSARAGPRSSSTSASARSMPAVTPAEVRIGPSATKIGSGSTVTAGKARASASHHAQCVVARRPSSSPARASRKAPVQTEATRRARGAASGDPADEQVVGRSRRACPRRRRRRACRAGRGRRRARGRGGSRSRSRSRAARGPARRRGRRSRRPARTPRRARRRRGPGRPGRRR